MENNELLRIISAPFCFLCNSDKIDSENKTITFYVEDGVYDYLEVTYERRYRQVPDQAFADFHSSSISYVLNNPLQPRFSIKYLYEKVNGEETKYGKK